MKTTMLPIFYLSIMTIWRFVTATGTLSARQNIPPIPTNGIPSACTANCTTPTLQNCLSMTNSTCLCNPTVENALFSCFLCLGQMDGDFAELQSSINVLVGACDSLGLTLSDLTFPGQTATSVGPSSTSNGVPSPVSSTSNGNTMAPVTPSASTTVSLTEPGSTSVNTQSTSPTETGSNTTTTTSGSKPVGQATVLWTVVSILLSVFILQ